MSVDAGKTCVQLLFEAYDTLWYAHHGVNELEQRTKDQVLHTTKPGIKEKSSEETEDTAQEVEGKPQG